MADSSPPAFKLSRIAYCELGISDAPAADLVSAS
jgi:hypothetical protein